MLMQTVIVAFAMEEVALACHITTYLKTVHSMDVSKWDFSLTKILAQVMLNIKQNQNYVAHRRRPCYRRITFIL